jgi:hypothetical protein
MTNEEKKDEKFVKWSVFIWVVGIVSILMAALFSITLNLMSSFSDIRSDVSAIKTDVSWIKDSISDRNNVSIK